MESSYSQLLSDCHCKLNLALNWSLVHAEKYEGAKFNTVNNMFNFLLLHRKQWSDAIFFIAHKCMLRFLKNKQIERDKIKNKTQIENGLQVAHFRNIC